MYVYIYTHTQDRDIYICICIYRIGIYIYRETVSGIYLYIIDVYIYIIEIYLYWYVYIQSDYVYIYIYIHIYIYKHTHTHTHTEEASGNFTTTGRILFYNIFTQKNWKLQVHCSEFHAWQIHLNTKHGALYCPYSLVPDPQNFSIFLKCEASAVLGWIYIYIYIYIYIGERFLVFRFWAGLSNRRQELISMIAAAR